MTEEIQKLVEENTMLKTQIEALNGDNAKIKEQLEKSQKDFNELSEKHRQIITNGAPLPDSDNDVDKKFAELFKNI